MLNEVFERVLDLTRDMYGNYVISHVLEHGAPSDKLFVINKIKKKLLFNKINKINKKLLFNKINKMTNMKLLFNKINKMTNK